MPWRPHTATGWQQRPCTAAVSPPLLQRMPALICSGPLGPSCDQPPSSPRAFLPHPFIRGSRLFFNSSPAGHHDACSVCSPALRFIKAPPLSPSTVHREPCTVWYSRAPGHHCTLKPGSAMQRGSKVHATKHEVLLLACACIILAALHEPCAMYNCSHP